MDYEILNLTTEDITNYYPSQYVQETYDTEEQTGMIYLTEEANDSSNLAPLVSPPTVTMNASPITYVKSISSAKDKTSDNGNNYSMMRKIFYSHNNNNKQNKFNDSSSYIQNKKMIATGRQSLNNNVVFFTNNNHLEIKQAKRLLRSRGSGIPKKNIK